MCLVEQLDSSIGKLGPPPYIKQTRVKFPRHIVELSEDVTRNTRVCKHCLDMAGISGSLQFLSLSHEIFHRAEDTIQSSLKKSCVQTVAEGLHFARVHEVLL